MPGEGEPVGVELKLGLDDVKRMGEEGRYGPGSNAAEKHDDRGGLLGPAHQTSCQ